MDVDVDAMTEVAAELPGEVGRSVRKRRHGALTARERLEALFDPGSFVEWGAEVEPAPQLFGPQPQDAAGDGVIAGHGRIEGRLAFGYAQDFAVMEGTLGQRGAQKIVDLLDRAVDAGAPVVGLLHSNGARLSEGINSLEACTGVFQRYIVYSGRIPIITLAMGFCSGFPAYLASLSDVVIMVERTSFLVTTSPAVIRAATGQQVRLPELGGSRIHGEVSGVAHLTAPSEPAAIELARTVVGYLAQEGRRDAAEPLLAMPRLPQSLSTPYDVLPFVRAIVDGSEFLELWPRWARSVAVGFARLGGRAVGVVANQPLFDAGAVTVRSARKMSRFVRLCDAFGLPLVFLVDVPGILPGVESEHEGILVEGAQFFRALNTDVPRLTLVLRKCYGGAYGLLNSHRGGGALVLAYPFARIGVAGVDVALHILGGEEDDAEAGAALADAWRNLGDSAQAAARLGVVDRIISPEQTRAELLSALDVFPPRSGQAAWSRLRRSGWR